MGNYYIIPSVSSGSCNIRLLRILQTSFNDVNFDTGMKNHLSQFFAQKLRLSSWIKFDFSQRRNM